MKLLYTLIFVIIFSEYAGAIELTSAAKKISCQSLDNTFECAQLLEAKLLLKEKSILARRDGLLAITTKSKSVYEVKDNKGLENQHESENYLAIDISKDKRFVSLFVQYYEGNIWSIFDRQSGLLTPVCGYPLYSPKGHYLAFSEVNLYTDMTPTCLEIYEIESQSIKKVFRAEVTNKWGPDNAGWVNETLLRFNKLEWNPLRGDENQPEFISSQFELRREDEKWVMTHIK